MSVAKGRNAPTVISPVYAHLTKSLRFVAELSAGYADVP